jgi:galactose oxidase
MAYQRAFANSVVLPDGTVLTVGGQSHPVPFTDDNSAMAPELWNPKSGAFTVMAPMTVPRNYHSVALLLPDGRVFTGGGGLCGTCATNHPDAQLFTPPYLLNPDGSLRSRPTITNAPATARPGSTVTVTTDRPVSSFALVRAGEATHSVDNDQRRVPLTISSTAGTSYGLAIPADTGILLPGEYMLFAIDTAGTPSIATMVKTG